MVLPLSVCLIPNRQQEPTREWLETVAGFAAEMIIFEPNDHWPSTIPVHRCEPPATPTDTASWYNAGQSMATQPWLLFLKCDESIEPNSLNTLADLLQSEAQVIWVRCCESQWGLMGMQPRLLKTSASWQWQGVIYPEIAPTDELREQDEPHFIIAGAGSPVTQTEQEARRQLLEAALQQESPRLKDFYYLGLTCFALKQDDAAKTAFNHYLNAIQYHKTHPVSQSGSRKAFRIVRLNKPEEGDFYAASSHLYLGKLMWEQKAYAPAYDYLQLWSLRQPSLEHLPGLWVMRGVMARHYREMGLAIECFQKALSLNHDADLFSFNRMVSLPDVTWKPNLGIAEAYFEQGRFLQAYHAYQVSLLELPEHPYVLLGLAQCCFLLKRYEELNLILASTPALLADFAPEIVQALKWVTELNLTGVTPALIQQAQALDAPLNAYLSQELTIAPFVVSVLFDYAVALLKENQQELARSVLHIVSQLMPNLAAVWHNLGYVALAARDFEQAQECYQRALKINPKMIDSLIDLGKLAVMQGQIDRAQQYFQQVLDQYPAHRWVKQAMEQIEGSELSIFDTPTRPTAEIPESPFIFILPVPPTWEHGGDIVLKAYLEEFVAEDQVALAIPGSAQSPLIEQALHWANQRFTPELLPPIIWLDQPMDLIPGYCAWVLPSRLPLLPQAVQPLQDSNYPTLLPPPLGTLEVRWVKEFPTDIDDTAERCWHEVTTKELTQAMRALWRSKGTPHPDEGAVPTHLLLSEGQSVWTEPLNWHQEQTPLTAAPTVSVCMMVKNESAFIEPLLQQLLGDADEMIVVDTGSTDDTLAILQRYPQIKVLHQPWVEDFATMRNNTLAQAQSDWILVLDADERLPLGFWPTLKRHLIHAPESLDAFVFPIVALNEWGQENLAETLLVPRVFRNQPCYHYVGMVHEMLVHRDKEKMNYYYLRDLPLWHLGYQAQIKVDRDKEERYLNLMLQNLQDSPHSTHVLRFYQTVGHLYQTQKSWDKAESYYRQGLAQNPQDSLLLDALTKGLIQVLMAQQQWAAALTIMDQYNHSDGDICWLQGLSHQQQGHYATAQTAFESALAALESASIHPRQFQPGVSRLDVLVALSQLAQASNDYAAALYWLKRALKMQPEAHELWKRFEGLQSLISHV